MTKSQVQDPSGLEHLLDHQFHDPALLLRALTHSSFAREAESALALSTEGVSAGDNEQLEFLGDSILSFVVSQELFRRYPQFTEGDLSKLRAHIVSARALIRPARQLDIGNYLRFGRGEEKSGGRTKSALLVNALEALIAALFLDAGLEKAHRFIVETVLAPALDDLQTRTTDAFLITDYKSALQEAAQAVGRPQPRYSVVKEKGPDHRKIFTVEVQILPSSAGGESLIRRSEGSTKKNAEQGAARQAWEYLKSLLETDAGASGVPERSSETA
jgi:ribonuclease-3